MRRLPTLCLLALAPLTGMAPQAQAASLYNLLVGTYTEGSSEGIQVYRFDGADGSVKGPLRVAHTSNPSYLTVAPDQRTLFVVNENGRG
ncbi:beta-propeller fold lactonase family protein, partial [Escherichia coli]|nr:beta-propeller fold lactonase family protein [Escherichia coli]